MTFVKKQFLPFNSAPADPLFNFTQPFIQQGVISGRYYSADEISYGNPKPGYLQATENSNVVTVEASSATPLRLVFALGLHDANTSGEINSWRTFTGKTSSNTNITITASEKAWVYAEINENGQPNNPAAWTIQYASEPAKDRTYSSQVDEPNAPVDGDVWFNPITNLLKKYNADTSQWDTKKRVYLGEIGVGTNGYVYSVQSWFPELGYAEYQDSFYSPWFENPWRHYDGVSFTTNGQYTAMEAANWANNATIGQAVSGNRIAMEAVANSAAGMSNVAISANTYVYIANSNVALSSLEANTTGIGFIANSENAMILFANNTNVLSYTIDKGPYFDVYVSSTIASKHLANSAISVPEIANSSVAMARIANSSVAMSHFARNSTFTNLIATNVAQVAIEAVANSAIAQGAIVGGPNIASFRTALASSPSALAKFKVGSAGNVLFDVIANTTTYTTIAANSSGQLLALANSVSGPILATGGSVSVVSSGGIDYRLHSFTSTGQFNAVSVGEQSQIQHLLVAGGGGGGSAAGGGGGAGGFLQNVTPAGHTLSQGAVPYTVTIGGGGSNQTNGSNTTFSTLTAVGGGTQRGADGNPSGAGGSGGGGNYGTNWPGVTPGGLGTPGQGTNGGYGTLDSSYFSGGGGGAGGAGQNGRTPWNAPLVRSGNGGISTTSSFTGTPVEYAGGGGGGVWSGSIFGFGGGAGAGNGEGGPSVNGQPATIANRGSGGGGAGWVASGGSGSSGVAHIRYALSKI